MQGHDQPEDPLNGIESVYVDKDGVEHAVKTQQKAGEDPEKLVKRHARKLRAMMKAFPPARKPTTPGSTDNDG